MFSMNISSKAASNHSEAIPTSQRIYLVVAFIGFILFEVSIYSVTHTAFDTLIGDILFFLFISGLLLVFLGYLFAIMGFTKITMFVCKILIICALYGVPYVLWFG